MSLNRTRKVEAAPPSAVTGALERLAQAIRDRSPPGTIATFRYDGRLRVDIDVRTLEDVRTVEAVLPLLDEAVISEVRRGKSPSAFLHRVTAEVLV